MSFEKVYVDSYYIDIYEYLSRLDGTESYYSKMFNGHHRKVRLGDSLYIRTFTELRKRMLESMKDAIGDIETFKCEEVEFGWEFTRYVKTDDEGDVYDIVTEGEHTDTERYVVDVTLITEENPMKDLKRHEKIRKRLDLL